MAENTKTAGVDRTDCHRVGRIISALLSAVIIRIGPATKTVLTIKIAVMTAITAITTMSATVEAGQAMNRFRLLVTLRTGSPESIHNRREGEKCRSGTRLKTVVER